MAPLSQRRHRIDRNELPEVIEGLRLRLKHLLKERDDPERAKIAFHTLWRLLGRGTGRPKYPEFNWENLRLYLEQYVPKLD